MRIESLEFIGEKGKRVVFPLPLLRILGFLDRSVKLDCGAGSFEVYGYYGKVIMTLEPTKYWVSDIFTSRVPT
jgi:hypothetical protein